MVSDAWHSWLGVRRGIWSGKYLVPAVIGNGRKEIQPVKAVPTLIGTSKPLNKGINDVKFGCKLGQTSFDVTDCIYAVILWYECSLSVLHWKWWTFLDHVTTCLFPSDKCSANEKCDWYNLASNLYKHHLILSYLTSSLISSGTLSQYAVPLCVYQVGQSRWNI